MRKKRSARTEARRQERMGYWGGHIENYEQGELTRREYCAKHQLSYHGFTYWRKRLKDSRALAARRGLEGLMQVDTTQVVEIPAFSGCYGSGYSMRLNFRQYQVELSNQFSPVALQDLLRMLNPTFLTLSK